MTRTFNKHPKRCNSNATNSRFKTVAGELLAQLVSVSCGGRRSGGARTLTPEPRRWCGGTRGTCRVADGRRRGLAGQHTDTPTDWRPPRGLRGLAGLRADAPSEARGADGERAGRPRGGRRSVGATSNTKPPGPTGGRAAHASGRKAALSDCFSASGCRRSPGAGRPRRRGRPCRPRPTCPTCAGRTASSRRPRRRS